MRRTTVAVPEGVDALVEGLVEESHKTGEVPSLTQSDVLRLLLRDSATRLVDGDLRVSDETREVHPDVDGEALAALIPEHKRAKFLYDERKGRNWLNDMRGGFEGRVLDRLSERFSNGYDPEDAEALAEEYIGEARDLWVRVGDDPETFEEKREFVVEAVDKYRHKHDQTTYDPLDEFLEGFSGVEDGEVEETREDVEESVRAVAEERYADGSGPSAEALTDSLSVAFDVDPEVIRPVVEEVRRERVLRDERRSRDLSQTETPAITADGHVPDSEAVAPDARRDVDDVEGVEVDGILASPDGGDDEHDPDDVDRGDGPRTDGGSREFTPGMEGYWSSLDDEPDAEPDSTSTSTTVRERIREVVDGEIHGIAVTAVRRGTYYCVVSHEGEEAGGDVVALRTVVVDLDAESVSPSDNALWVPRQTETLTALTRVVARTQTDLANPGENPEPLRTGVEGVDVESLLDERVEESESDDVDGQHVDKMKNHTGIDPSRSWGYGAGPPSEVETVVDRLRDVGLDPSEHLTRLVWGKKEPMDRVPRPVEELTGNYGIELLPRDSGLVALDVDYPEEFPDDEVDLPRTLSVSSPHGDDSQRHVLLRCNEKDRIAEKLGAWAVQSVEWGDLWIGDRFVVGPGSQLSEFGCDEDPHDRGERGGCEHCEDPDGGRYQIVEDAPIAEVDAETVLDLARGSLSEAEPRDGRADPEPPESDEEPERDDDPSGPRCDACGREHDDESALKELSVAGTERRICRGGCE